MNQLDKDAVAASKKKMSYGQYIAMYKPPLQPVQRPVKKTKDLARGQEKRNGCVICGGTIPGKNRKYCSPECAYRGQLDNYNARRLRNMISDRLRKKEVI